MTYASRRIRVTPIIFSALCFTLFVSAAEARSKENQCNWKSGITSDRLAKSDALLYRKGDPKIKSTRKEHLPFGMPKKVSQQKRTNELLLTGPYFLIWYDKDLRAPLWTAHHLTGAEAALTPRKNPDKAEKRRDSFRSDPRLDPDERSFCSDYKEKVFDQGHMVPNADLDWIDQTAGYSVGMDHSFLMSNMTPQHCEFNRGPWQVLEGLTRKWAAAAPDTWIITGAVYDYDGTPGRDPDNKMRRMSNILGIESVAVPSHQYKIIVQRDGTNWKTISIILPNDETLITSAQRRSYLTDRVTTLDEIAKLSGVRFLHRKNVTEATSLLPFDGGLPALLTSGC